MQIVEGELERRREGEEKRKKTKERKKKKRKERWSWRHNGVQIYRRLMAI
jgi:hypothetical protein